MARRRNSITRREVTDRGDKIRTDMQTKVTELKTRASDVETTRETLAKLERAGTAEGVNEVERHIDRAEAVTVDAFEREDRDLEKAHRDSSEYESDLRERTASTKSDVKEITDASNSIKTREPLEKLNRARDAATRDMEHLAGAADRARTAREETERLRKEAEARVKRTRR